MIMQKPFPGPFRYNKTPYTREIIDCVSANHPARTIAVMKGAQIGYSAGVIYPAIGWIIKNNPGNTFVTVGAPDLIEKAMEKLDLMIDATKLRPYIKPQVLRNRMNKSGDTNVKKEFPGGYVTVASANNHKAIRQVDLQYGFFDDFESVKTASKESGDTRKLLEQRFAAYADTCKIFYISTPELKQGSNIEPAYLLGDQRKYLIPCPCCGEFIELRWNVPEGIGTIWDKPMPDGTGIVWEVDENTGRVKQGSVGYVCQMCNGFFTDKHKTDWLNKGFWQPTAEPSREGYYSYHISSLYAPVGMYDWAHYVKNYVDCHPKNQPRLENEYKTFVNTCLGITYEMAAQSLDSKSIQKNIRPYQVGTIPEKLSIADGNGRIVLITCAADMNGTVDDARLDYEVVAWSERGASYSIEHGSIGTFVRGEGSMRNVPDRPKSSYEFNVSNSVWTQYDRILDKVYTTDTGRSMKIFKSGLDCGYFSKNYAYPYIDSKPVFPLPQVFGLKGKGEDEYIMFDKDVKNFKPALERQNLYILTVGRIKDELAEYMQLRWDERKEDAQPYGFMNFPTPERGLYGFGNYFEHFESEHRVVELNPEGNGIAAAWKKKGNIPNHMLDCRVYNIAVRDIIMEIFRKELKLPKLTWKEFALALTGGK